MTGLAHVATVTGDHNWAARLCGAAMASSDNSPIPLEPIAVRRIREVIDRVRASLDDRGLEAELDRGRTDAQQVTVQALVDAVDDHAALANAVATDLENVATNQPEPRLLTAATDDPDATGRQPVFRWILASRERPN